MQFFLYELVPSALGGSLAQFLCAAAQGYVCGCFYPYTFFPEALQRVGKALPAGTALRYLSAVVRGAGGNVTALLLWTLGFLAAAAAVRAWRYGRVGA